MKVLAQKSEMPVINPIVYMFHAIGYSLDDGSADLHYNYDKERVVKLLNQVGGVTSLEETLKQKICSRHVATFDDGHISNYEAALLMSEYSLGVADFFVNPNVVGNKGFMTWAQLNELSELGMSIQSHSLDHVYLSNLSELQQREQLYVSKQTIEQNLGTEVTILAPPNGRYNKTTEAVARELGYKMIANSKPGRWCSVSSFVVPRIPVLEATPIETLVRCTQVEDNYVRKLQLKYFLTGSIKKLLGTSNYEKFRTTMLSLLK